MEHSRSDTCLYSTATTGTCAASRQLRGERVGGGGRGREGGGGRGGEGGGERGRGRGVVLTKSNKGEEGLRESTGQEAGGGRRGRRGLG